MFLRPLEWRFLPPLLNNSRDPKQPEVCDYDFIGIMKNILWLQVFVNNAFSVQIAHSLCRKTKWEFESFCCGIGFSCTYRFGLNWQHTLGKLILYKESKKETYFKNRKLFNKTISFQYIWLCYITDFLFLIMKVSLWTWNLASSIWIHIEEKKIPLQSPEQFVLSY